MLFNYDVTLSLFRWKKCKVFELKEENKHQTCFTATCSGRCRLCGVIVGPIKTSLPSLFNLISLRSILKKPESEVFSGGQSATISTNQLPLRSKVRGGATAREVSARTGRGSEEALRQTTFLQQKKSKEPKALRLPCSGCSVVKLRPLRVLAAPVAPIGI